MNRNINKFILISIIVSVFIGVTGYSIGMSLGKNSIAKDVPVINDNREDDYQANDDEKASENNTVSQSPDTASNNKAKADNKKSSSSDTGGIGNRKTSSGSNNTGYSSGPSRRASSVNTSIPSQLKDGVYNGSASGYGGEIRVKVTVSNGKISDIKVESHSETPEYYDRCSGIIPSIISSQSTNVDGVSGATFTSNGIKAAVADALKSAGASSASNSSNSNTSKVKPTESKNSQSADKEEIKKLKKQIKELQDAADVKDKLKDGKYQGNGTGFKGNVKAEVVVSGGKISSINILENIDDAPYFDKAKTLIPSIISKQSLRVDSISGATYSSNGIKSAVRDALKKAGSSQDSDLNEETNRLLSKVQEENKKLKDQNSGLKNKIESLENEAQKDTNINKKLKDGRYSGSGAGFKGDVKVQVDVSGGKISNINIVDNVDDAPYFDKAKSLVGTIISKQTPNVDSISGATYSSNGIKSAVRDAIKKAGVSSEGDNSEEVKQQLAKLTKLEEKNKQLKKLTKELRERIESLESESQKDLANKKLKDGSYEGRGIGFRGDVKVQVDVSGGKISNINIVDNVDDAPYFDKAKSLVGTIISKQTPNVDSISGATYSSNGIKSAVRDALKKAGVSSEGDNNDELKIELSRLKEENQKLKDAISGLKAKIEDLEKKSQKEDANIRMKDGSYQGIGMGFKGNVRVEVKVTDGKIASINVIDNIDDAPFFDRAKSLIPNIISSQTANVDSVSGATYSSNGIKSAVRDALKKAGSSQESVNNDEINKKLEKLSKLEEKLKQMKKLSKDLRKKVESLEAESQKYMVNKKLKDGSYEGSGIGFRGNLKVEVDVSEGKISSIRVVENVDDAPYFEKARGLITNIVSGQTPNVDSVSGATYSSNGIKSAVRDALKKAYIEEDKSYIQSENDKLKKAIEENEKVENEIKALREENTSLKEKNTLLMSIIDSLKKKIHGIAYGDLTKELYDSFISVLNNSDGLNTGKEN
ncbi:FMN-binding protein [Peptostreptococcus stomatis]|uniref:FMN-binding protein n=1 Tax=Peptostreptococcus stomatis TaxID=341694 RepID=UPI0026F0D5A8|nr:FMN-binding protein [Peptostreptococcus stomatis]